MSEASSEAASRVYILSLPAIRVVVERRCILRKILTVCKWREFRPKFFAAVGAGGERPASKDCRSHSADIRLPERRPMTGALEKAGHIVHQFCDCTLDGSRYDVIVALEKPFFARTPVATRANTEEERPLVVAWHFDPLPPPRASGLWWPVPGLHEFARIVLRRYAFDPYTNYVRLRDLARSGIADLIAVSSNGRVEFLAERGITAYYAPLVIFPSLAMTSEFNGILTCCFWETF